MGGIGLTLNEGRDAQLGEIIRAGTSYIGVAIAKVDEGRPKEVLLGRRHLQGCDNESLNNYALEIAEQRNMLPTEIRVDLYEVTARKLL